MRRINVRDVSGELLHDASLKDQILGITVNGALAGVLVPFNHAILARLRTAGEHATAERAPTLETDMLHGVEPSELEELLREPADQSATGRSLNRISIREFSGTRLKQASESGDPLVITSDRVAVAVVLPLEATWIESLVEASVEGLLSGNGTSEPSEAVPAFRPTISGGRFRRQRAIGVRIIPDAADNKTRLVGVVTDPMANPQGETVTLPLLDLEETYVVSQILDLVGRLRSRMGSDEELLGVGVEVGGHIRNRRVIGSRNTRWDHFALADMLSHQLDVDVVLENDANALAIYEHDFSHNGVDSEHFAVVLMTHLGIGCGLMLDGQLYRGTGGMAGELGHTPIWKGREPRDASAEPVEAPCRCGRRHCVEGIATPYGIQLELASRGIKVDFPTALELAPTDTRVAEVFELAGRVFGSGIATLISILNPDDVVFYGPLELFGEARSVHIDHDRIKAGTKGSMRGDDTAASIYTSAMEKAIIENTFSDAAAECRYFFRKRDNDQGAVAAAASLLKTIRSTSAARRTHSLAHD